MTNREHLSEMDNMELGWYLFTQPWSSYVKELVDSGLFDYSRAIEKWLGEEYDETIGW